MIIRCQKTENYSVMSNECLRNGKLSARAKGIHSYLMTLPNNWKINKDELRSHFTEGRDSFNSAFRELEENGYIHKEPAQENGSGKLNGWNFVVVEISETSPDSSKQESGIPVDRTTGKPSDGKPTPIKYLKKVSTNPKKGNKNYPTMPTSKSALFETSTSTISKPMMHILKGIKELAGFRTQLPGPDKPASQVIIRCLRYLKWIKAGLFSREVQLEPDWQKKFIKDWPSSRGYDSWREVRDLVMESLKRFVDDRDGSKKLGRGIWFPADMSQFFLNIPMGKNVGKSMFLKYHNIVPKTADEQGATWQKDRIPVESRKLLEEMYTKIRLTFIDRDYITFWGNMLSLCSWYDKRNKDLTKLNRAYHDNNWGYHCGTLEGFIQKVIQYLTDYGGRIQAKPLPPDSNNAYFQRFRAWMLNSYGIEIFADDNLLDKADGVMKGRKDDEKDLVVETEMHRIEGVCQEIGEPIPEYDELRKSALRNLEKNKGD